MKYFADNLTSNLEIVSRTLKKESQNVSEGIVLVAQKSCQIWTQHAQKQ